MTSNNEGLVENTYNAEEKVWHFICTRKNKGAGDVKIAFKVYGYNVFNATNRAYKRILKIANEQVFLLNSDYTFSNPYEVGENENMLGVSIRNTNIKCFADSLIFYYTDFELLNEQEYDSLSKSVWKDFI